MAEQINIRKALFFMLVFMSSLAIITFLLVFLFSRIEVRKTSFQKVPKEKGFAERYMIKLDDLALRRLKNSATKPYELGLEYGTDLRDVFSLLEKKGLATKVEAEAVKNFMEACDGLSKASHELKMVFGF